jgi:hypothetical protein
MPKQLTVAEEEELRSLYFELKGKRVATESKDHFISEDAIVNDLNRLIGRVSDVTGDDYSAHKLTRQPGFSQVSWSAYKVSLLSVIGKLYGASHFAEADPFEKNPGSSQGGAGNQQTVTVHSTQTQQLHLTLIVDLATLAQQKISETEPDTPECTFWTKLKEKLAYTKDAMDAIKSILQVAQEAGVLDKLPGLFS